MATRIRTYPVALLFALAMLPWALAGCPDDDEPATGGTDAAQDAGDVTPGDIAADTNTQVDSTQTDSATNDVADDQTVEDTSTEDLVADVLEDVADLNADVLADIISEDLPPDLGPLVLADNVRFLGAPPTMPPDAHTSALAMCGTNCLDCHASGGNQTPHPERLMCRQCHLQQNDVALFVENSFGE